MTTMPANVSHYGGTRAVNVDRLVDSLLTTSVISANGTHYAGSGLLVPLPEYGSGHATGDPRLRPRVAEWVGHALPAVTAVGASPWRYLRSMVYPYGDVVLDVVEAWSDAEEAEALAAARARGVGEVWHAGRRGWVDVARRAA